MGTVFFLMGSTTVSVHWKTSLNVGALVTLVAAVHYFYMREFWVQLHSSPILYRYIDWTITVPLQMIEFYLILAAVKPDISKGMFLRLPLGMAGWAFILFEVFMGEAGQVCGNDPKVNQYVREAFSTMRFIVSVGWSIYPLGYFFGYLTGAVDDSILNLVYNLADFVNKIGFCLAIWASAKNSTAEKEGALLG